MVIRNIHPAVPAFLGNEVIAHNSSIFRGEGALGKDFVQALVASKACAGSYFIEALVNATSGKIVEILQPNPFREYEQEVTTSSGEQITVPVELSRRNPSAQLAVFVVDAVANRGIVDVIARDEITSEARAALSASIGAFGPDHQIRSLAA